MASMGSSDPDRRLLQARKEWQRLFKDAFEGDTWGDLETAAETYEKLDGKIGDELDMIGNDISPQNLKVINKIRTCISLRIEALNSPGKANSGLPLKEMKKLLPLWDDLFQKPIDKFPISGVDHIVIENNKQDIIDEGDVPRVNEKTNENKSEDATVHVFVDKIGLKDATNYIDAQLKVSVVDKSGRVIESQTTPKSRTSKATFVMFGDNLYFKTPTANFQKKGYNFFFEFIHYKPKKKKISTRCYAFMEPAELADREGELCCLELYKKPTDYTRKRVNLHTIKRLYCHVKVAFMD